MSTMSLDDLLQLSGVVAAGEFTPDGKLVAYKATMPMSAELAAMSAQFCATVSMLFATLAGAFGQLSRMPWTPSHGWAYSGGDYTIAVAGTRGVFVETAKADFNQLFAALVGPRSPVG